MWNHSIFSVNRERLVSEAEDAATLCCKSQNGKALFGRAFTVNVDTTLGSGAVKCDMELIMSARSIDKIGAALGADKGDDAAAFVKQLRRLEVRARLIT